MIIIMKNYEEKKNKKKMNRYETIVFKNLKKKNN